MKQFFSLFSIFACAGLLSTAGYGQKIKDNGTVFSEPGPVTTPNYLGNCDTLSTTLVSDNSQYGNMFTIRANKDIIIESFEGNIQTSGTIIIYYKTGSYSGFVSTPGAWTLIDSAYVTTNGTDTATQIPIPVEMELDSGDVVSFYITANMDGGYLNYTNGTTEGDTSAINNELLVYEGIGVAYPFGTSYTPRVWNGIIHYCPNIDYCDDLTTIYTGGNGNDGVVFEMAAVKNTVIHSFEAAVSDTGYISIYYRPGAYVGTTGSPAGWTLADSVFVQSAGYLIPTKIPIDVNVYMPAGSLYSFLITGSGLDAQGMDYTNGTAVGAVFVSDNTLQIREGEGFGAPWGGGNGLPRIFNGSVRYCEDMTDQTVLCQDIFTTDSAGNGNSGIMFDIDAKGDAVEIESFETYFTGPGLSEVRIYYKTGTHIGFEADGSTWTLLDSMMVNVAPIGQKTLIPIPVNVEIPANSKMAFFIYSDTYGVEYTDGFGVTVPDTLFAEDMYVRVHEGSGKGGIFTPSSNNPRVYNGEINYCVLENFSGIDEPLNGEEIQVWPNPSNGIFAVSIPNASENILGVEIIDMNGKTVRSFSQPAGTLINVDISDTAPGVYFVKVSTDKNIHTKKYIHSGK